MNGNANNNVAFRLPDEPMRELNRLAATHKQSQGRLAKNMVIASIMDFSRFDEMNHRLNVIERALQHLVEQSERLAIVEAAVDRLRASLATVTTRLLVESSQTELDEAVSWTKQTFGVEEDR